MFYDFCSCCEKFKTMENMLEIFFNMEMTTILKIWNLLGPNYHPSHNLQPPFPATTPRPATPPTRNRFGQPPTQGRRHSHRKKWLNFAEKENYTIISQKNYTITIFKKIHFKYNFDLLKKLHHYLIIIHNFMILTPLN